MKNLDIINYTKQKMTEKPGWFLFREEEPKVTNQDLERLEQAYSASLPTSYRDFLSHFGGGTFAFVALLSPAPQSVYSIWDWLARHPKTPQDFLPLYDDEAGGVYGFVKKQGRFADQVYYLDLESPGNSAQPTQRDFASFFLKVAYQEERNT